MAKTKIFILAGGTGTRFWPVSRTKCPKQFLPLGTTPDSLLQATARRAQKIVSSEDLYVVTSATMVEKVREHATHATIIAEPVARNTAASIGLAAIHAARAHPSTVMVNLPADHAVAREDALVETLQTAISLAAEQPVLVTIGIRPSFPHTGYGYIQRGKQLRDHSFTVKRFFEKPNLERAQSYCESGDFYWNSGMFAWRAETILAAIMTCMPGLYDGLMRIEKTIDTPQYEKVMREVFEGLESTSIDFGVLEHVKNCAVVEAQDFGWNDVGSWDAWADQFSADQQGNMLLGECLAIDSKNCIVRGDQGHQKRLTALLGVENLVVIDAGDALLICPRDRVQEVKKVVDELRLKGRVDLV